MDRKQRLRLIHERNRRNQLIFQHAEQHQQTVDATREAQNQAPPPPPEESDTPVWSARTQEVRNKLTGKKNMARDRWNRFAGTAGGGGMGR
ncbi:MAG: hypothetical protein K2Q12_00470 [Rickettsiales bacterium]|nr:hypothetical protein [Rickettsiales bacterium]